MDKKMRILFTIPNFKTAGSQFVLLAIYRNLDRNFFKPMVLVEKYPTIFPKEIEDEDRLYLSVSEKPMKRINELSSLLKLNRIDVLHSWDYKSASTEAIACRLVGVNYIYTKKNNAWSKRWLVKSILSKHIAYDHPEMFQRFFNQMTLSNKVSLVPHGVDLSIFKPKKKIAVNKKFIMGCIGVLGENKNQLFILRALTKLPESVCVEFYGKGDEAYISTMDQFIIENNLKERVQINDFVENKVIPKILSSFSILVLASKNEGLPLTLLEAMACGIPVLSSDSGGGARFIVDNDKGGFVFENEDDFIKKVKILIKDNSLLMALSEKAIKRVVENFSIEKEVSAYEKIYKSLMN